MTYSVRYRRIGGWKWTAIRNCVADGFLDGWSHRWFALKDETRIEVPAVGTIFEFGAARSLVVKSATSKAGA